MFLKCILWKQRMHQRTETKSVHIFWARLASFCHLGFISDPLIVSKFHNETHDPKGQENKIYTIVKDRETFYRRHTVPVTSCSEVKYVFKMYPLFCAMLTVDESSDQNLMVVAVSHSLCTWISIAIIVIIGPALNCNCFLTHQFKHMF